VIVATAGGFRSQPAIAGADVRGEGPGVGAQLHAVRLAQRKTLAEVAAASGLTKGFVSRLERDQATASVASLLRLCQALGISVGALFHAAPGEVIRRDDYAPINFGGTGVAEYLLTPRGERRVQAILSEIGPGGGSGDEPYSLPADVEFVFVLEGRLQIRLREEEILLEPGDALTFPPHIEHTFRSVRPDGPTRVLWVFCPALSVEGSPDAEPVTAASTNHSQGARVSSRGRPEGPAA
jgi:transcriptional regulator with XRE-family HTH domain